MKKHKNKKITEPDFLTGIINCLMYENTILRKKQNNEQLSKEEEIFDTLIIPPSFLLQRISKIERGKNENEKI